MSGSRPTTALLVVLSLLAAATPSRASAPSPAVTAARRIPVCQTVITIRQAPPSPTAQTSVSVTVEYGEVVTTNPSCLSVAGGESFAFTVNGVDRTSYFTYGYNATTERNVAYGTNVPLIAGMTNTLVATTYGGRPAGDVGTVSATAQVLVTASIAVTPDNMAADVRPLRQNTQPFTLVNGPTATSYTRTASCTGTATGCAPSASSVSLAAGASAIVGVTYQAGPTGTTGTVKLLATWQANTATKDSGSVNVTVRSVGSAVANVDLVNPGTSIERDLCLTIAMGSGAASECGDLRLAYALPTTRTKNKARTPTLLYNSQHAHPYPLIAANVTIPSTIAPPDSVTAKVFFGPTLKASGTWAGSDFVTGGTRRIVLGFDALTNPTGLYPYTLEVKSWYDTDPPYTQTVASTLVIVNRSSLGSGAGWWIAGVEYLYFADSSKVLWVGGDGSTRLYQPAPSTIVNGATRCNWAAATLDRPDTLSSNCAGAYTRHAPHGVKVEFDGSGKHVRTINRLKDTTSFTWHPTLQRVESIRIPPTPANLSYSFSYNATSGFLDSIVAPPAGMQRRVIRVSTDLGMVFNPGGGNMSGGRITALRGPDTSQVRFTYASTSYRAQTRTDRRGTVRTFTYDAGQRITRDSLAMGAGSADIVTAFQPQETQGLVGSSRPTAADTALMSSVFDGPRSDAGDTTRFWLNRWGAPTKIRNALGYETTLTYGDSRWPALVTLVVAPNGRKQSAAYDPRGNLVSATDSSTGGGATDRHWWNQCDAVDSTLTAAGVFIAYGYDLATCNRVWQQPGRSSTRRVTFRFYATGAATNLLRAIALPSGARDSIQYDTANLMNVASTISPMGFTVRRYGDFIGRDTLVVSPIDSAQTLWREDSVVYDINDQVVRQVAREATKRSVVVSTFDPEGSTLSVARSTVPDPRYVFTGVTWFAYDRAGRKMKETAPDGFSDSTEYDVGGNAVTLRTRLGDVIRQEFDALNQLRRRIVPAAAAWDTVLAGQTYPYFANCQTSKYCISGDTSTFSYDAMGNILVADNREAQVRRTYTLAGAVATDTLRIRTWAEVGAGGDFSTHVYGVRNGYDADGRRTWLKLPAQLAPRFAATPTATNDSIAYTFDTELGVVAAVRDPVGNSYSYHLNADGALDTLRFPLGHFKAFQYDIEGRPVRIRQDRTSTSTYYNEITLGRYDARGKATAIRPLLPDLLPSTALRYDGMGQLTTDSSVQRCLRMSCENGRRVSSEYEYDALGNVLLQRQVRKREAWGASCVEGTEYIFFTDSSSQTNAFEAYTDRLLRVTRRGDAMTRYTSAGYNCDTHDITEGVTQNSYDRSGNLRVIYDSSRSGWYARQASTPNWRVPTYFRKMYGYDADGRLRMFELRRQQSADSGVFEEYRYDALGRRVLVRARTGGLERSNFAPLQVIRRTVWDGSAILAEIAYPGGSAVSAASLERDTVTIQDSTATGFGRVLYVNSGTVDKPLAVVRIGYGNSIGVTFRAWEALVLAPDWDWKGQPYAHAFYGPTAECIAPGRCVVLGWPTRTAYLATDDPFGYTGGVASADTGAWFGSVVRNQEDGSGAQYLRNRYYDPATGRFTQEDPIGLAGGLNLYGFANGDPVNYSDPFGLCAKYKDGSEDANCRKLVDGLNATADEADKTLAAGQTNRFREAAAGYEATDREVEFVGALDPRLNQRNFNSDGNPATFALGRTMDDRILIGRFLGPGDVMAVATHEILVHGNEKRLYFGDFKQATVDLNRQIWSQLPGRYRPSAELWRRKIH